MQERIQEFFNWVGGFYYQFWISRGGGDSLKMRNFYPFLAMVLAKAGWVPTPGPLSGPATRMANRKTAILLDFLHIVW